MQEVKDRPTSLARQEVISSPEWLEINSKYRLFLMPFEHDLNLLPQQHETLKKGISATHASIFEYLRVDCGEAANWPTTHLFTREALPWFDEVSQICREAGKDILALDPAHGVEFGLAFRGLEFAEMMGGALLVSSTLLSRPVTRRDFLKLSGIGALGSALFLSGFATQVSLGRETHSSEGSNIPNESFFRMAVVAELIQQVGEKVKDESSEPISHALIYPSFHIERIKRLIKLPDERKRILANTAVLKAIPRFRNAFYAGRQYRWGGDGWQILNTIPSEIR